MSLGRGMVTVCGSIGASETKANKRDARYRSVAKTIILGSCDSAASRRPGPSKNKPVCFLVRDRSGQALAYVYFEEEPGPRSAAKLLTKDESRRIAAKIAKLPELLRSDDRLRPPWSIEKEAAYCCVAATILVQKANNSAVFDNGLLSALACGAPCRAEQS
jgi:hypothetical protein